MDVTFPVLKTGPFDLQSFCHIRLLQPQIKTTFAKMIAEASRILRIPLNVGLVRRYRWNCADQGQMTKWQRQECRESPSSIE